jgi:hypothetical protein
MEQVSLVVFMLRLHETGGHVTLFARGKHYQYLKQNGVIIKVFRNERLLHHD